MILGQGTPLKDVVDAFSDIKDRFVDCGCSDDSAQTSRVSVQDCWHALSLAKESGWIDLTGEVTSPSNTNDGLFDIDEFAHYAHQANGSVYTVIPGKLLCFPTPSEIPGGQGWMDVEGGSMRRFGAPYYAELFAELGVVVAVCLNESSYDRDAFLDLGIEVEDLGLDPSRPHMLRAIDRFHAVASAADSGLIAMHSGVADGPSHMGALVLSYLTGRLGFPHGAAVAWIRMVHPALLAAATTPPFSESG
jgi:hypothetical protein